MSNQVCCMYCVYNIVECSRMFKNKNIRKSFKTFYNALADSRMFQKVITFSKKFKNISVSEIEGNTQKIQ